MFRDTGVLEGSLRGISLAGYGSQGAFSYRFFVKRRFSVKNFRIMGMLEGYNNGHFGHILDMFWNFATFRKTLNLPQVNQWFISIFFCTV